LIVEAELNWFSGFFDPSGVGAVFTQFKTEIHQPQFWVALTEIIWINVLLSGDNALVVAMACRGLAPRHRLWGMILGAGAAVVLRILFTAIVATVMKLPYFKLVSGLALIVIAAKLLVPEKEVEEDGVRATSHLWTAIQIVVVADVVMSLDNVIAVAAAAGGSIPLLVLGLASSVPLIVAGAVWIAGDIIATDPAVQPTLHGLCDGPVGAKFDALLASLGMTKLVAVVKNGCEIACAMLGLISALIVGSIWRRCKLRQA
jgi:YjbE family integral membrane protein